MSNQTKIKRYYNVRNKISGTFQRTSPHNRVYAQTEFPFVEKCCGGSKCKATSRIIPGRIYSWNGVILRAHGTANGKRFCSIHKTLSGLIADSDLVEANKSEVENYLDHPSN